MKLTITFALLAGALFHFAGAMPTVRADAELSPVMGKYDLINDRTFCKRNLSVSCLDSHTGIVGGAAGQIAKRYEEFYVVYPASLDDDEDDDVERCANGNVVDALPFRSLLTYGCMS